MGCEERSRESSAICWKRGDGGCLCLNSYPASRKAGKEGCRKGGAHQLIGQLRVVSCSFEQLSLNTLPKTAITSCDNRCPSPSQCGRPRERCLLTSAAPAPHTYHAPLSTAHVRTPAQ